MIEVDGETARAQDGPINSDHHQHLQAVQSVQVVVKEGERLKLQGLPAGGRIARAAHGGLHRRGEGGLTARRAGG